MPLPDIPTPDLDDPKEIYAFAGLALYNANLVEASLLNLGAVLRLDQVQVITRQHFDAIFQNLEVKTLGQILKATRSLTSVTSDVDSVLSKTLEERNFLIHKFFREYAGDMVNDKGQVLVIERLRAMIELFQHADSLVTPIYMSLWRKYGVNESFIQRELAEMEAEIEAKYSKP